MYWVSGAVLGPLRAVLGHSWGLSRRSWDLCWRPWAALGLLLEVLGRYWGCCVRSWAALGTYLDSLELLLGPLLGPIFADCGRSWSLCGRSAAKKPKDVATLKMCLFLERERDARLEGRSWRALRAYVDGLGLLLGPLLAVLGRSWGLCWRSWAALRVYVGGPRGDQCAKKPKPVREGDLASGSGSKSCPGPSGKAIWASHAT